MCRFFSVIILLFVLIKAHSQGLSIPKNLKTTPEINQNLKPNGEMDLFKNLNHPLAITGGILILGGSATYIVGSEVQNNHNYQPRNTTQYVGIGAFVAGAVMFAIFSTERNENLPKRKKVKEKYNASEWEAPE